jgi:hypothetical protein
LTFYFGNQKQTNHKGKGLICSKLAKSFGKGVEAQRKITREAG